MCLTASSCFELTPRSSRDMSHSLWQAAAKVEFQVRKLDLVGWVSELESINVAPLKYSTRRRKDCRGSMSDQTAASFGTSSVWLQMLQLCLFWRLIWMYATNNLGQEHGAVTVTSASRSHHPEIQTGAPCKLSFKYHRCRRIPSFTQLWLPKNLNNHYKQSRLRSFTRRTAARSIHFHRSNRGDSQSACRA